jgi:hypothetical protein
VTEPAAPFAAGVHLPWAGVPEPVRHWAYEIGGGEAHEVLDLPGGFSPGATTRLRFAVGPDIFVKAVGLALNQESPSLHRREATISRSLPPSPYWPRLLNAYDDGDWVALAFEAVNGRMPAHPWVKAELDAALDALAELHRLLTPSPSDAVAAASARLGNTFDGWLRLASLDAVPAGLDGWAERHLEQLVDLESGWRGACDGDTLLHLDIRSDNLLLTEAGAVFVDWPHAAVGAPVLDLICWAPSVVLEGGPDPETLLHSHRLYGTADPATVTTLVAALAGFFVERSLQPPPPGLPTLRAFQAAQGEVALAWLQRRTGW